MAIYIKSIPTLTGEVAEKFNKRAEEAERKRGSIDFSKQIESAKLILANAKL